MYAALTNLNYLCLFINYVECDMSSYFYFPVSVLSPYLAGLCGSFKEGYCFYCKCSENQTEKLTHGLIIWVFVSEIQ